MPRKHNPDKIVPRSYRTRRVMTEPSAKLFAESQTRIDTPTMRALLEGLDVGVANLSTSGVILYANPRFAETLGIPAHADILGSNLKEHVSAGSWDSVDAALAQAIHTCIEGEMKVAVSGRARIIRVSLGCIRVKRTRTIRIVAAEVTELVEKSKALHDTEASLHSLSGRILQLQDEERRRIARDLHDITGQELAVVVMSLSHLASNLERPGIDVKKGVTDSVELIRKVEDEIRTLCYVLHPPLLDEMGLGSALKWYAEGFQKRTGIQVEVEIPAALQRFSAEKETALFRVVQESLTNVLRHSGSHRAWLRLSAASGRVRISVEDEGKGIRERDLVSMAGRKSKGLGVGIPGMRERLQQLGGRLEVRSGSHGTQVIAEVSLEEAVSRGDGGAIAVAESAQELGSEAAKWPVEQNARKKILIADDHEVTRRGMKTLLEDQPDVEICGEQKTVWKTWQKRES